MCEFAQIFTPCMYVCFYFCVIVWFYMRSCTKSVICFKLCVYVRMCCMSCGLYVMEIYIWDTYMLPTFIDFKWAHLVVFIYWRTRVNIYRMYIYIHMCIVRWMLPHHIWIMSISHNHIWLLVCICYAYNIYTCSEHTHAIYIHTSSNCIQLTYIRIHVILYAYNTDTIYL